MIKKEKEPLILKQGTLEYKFKCKPYEMEIWVKYTEF